MASKVWTVMNDLEMVTSKVCSAREIIDSAADALTNNDYTKAESLVTAAYEFLGYYLEEFDEKFKLAWKETITKEKEEDPCMPPWGHSDLEYAIKNDDAQDDPEYYNSAWNDFWKNDETESATSDKWILTVEEDNLNGELFITFPKELIEEVGWKENDTLQWIDNQNGSWTVKKQNK